MLFLANLSVYEEEYLTALSRLTDLSKRLTQQKFVFVFSTIKITHLDLKENLFNLTTFKTFYTFSQDYKKHYLILNLIFN